MFHINQLQILKSSILHIKWTFIHGLHPFFFIHPEKYALPILFHYPILPNNFWLHEKNVNLWQLGPSLIMARFSVLYAKHFNPMAGYFIHICILHPSIHQYLPPSNPLQALEGSQACPLYMKSHVDGHGTPIRVRVWWSFVLGCSLPLRHSLRHCPSLEIQLESSLGVFDGDFDAAELDGNDGDCLRVTWGSGGLLDAKFWICCSSLLQRWVEIIKQCLELA